MITTFINYFKRILFGYDIFISYSRVDGLDYAYSVAKHFLDKGYQCYLDQLYSSTPSKKLPANVKQAVKKSSAFVLIGSEGAHQSKAIQNEIQLFLENNKNKPLIPITINDVATENALWYEDIAGLALIVDTKEYLDAGTPSNNVLDRVEQSLKFTKKSAKLQRISIVMILSTLLITGFGFYQTSRAKEATREMNSVKEEMNNVTTSLNDTKERNKSLQDENLKTQSDLDQNKVELANSKTELEGSIQDLKFQKEETATNLLIGNASKFLNRDPKKALTYLANASQRSNDSRILSLFLDIIEDKSWDLKSHKLQDQIHDIAIDPTTQHIVVLTYGPLRIYDSNLNIVKTFDTKYIDELSKVHPLDNGNLIIEEYYPKLLNTKNRILGDRIDSLTFAKRYFSSNSNYYLNHLYRDFDQIAYKVIIDSGKLINLNDSLNLAPILNCSVSSHGKYFSLSTQDSTYIYTETLKRVKAFPYLATLKFSQNEHYAFGLKNNMLLAYDFATNEVTTEKMNAVNASSNIKVSNYNDSHFATSTNGNVLYWTAKHTSFKFSIDRTSQKESQFFPFEFKKNNTSLIVKDRRRNTQIYIDDFEGEISDYKLVDSGKKLVVGSIYGELKLYDLQKLAPTKIVTNEWNAKHQRPFIKGRTLFYIKKNQLSIIDLYTKEVKKKLPLEKECKEFIGVKGAEIYYVDNDLKFNTFNIETLKTKELLNVPVEKVLKWDLKNEISFIKDTTKFIHRINLKTKKYSSQKLEGDSYVISKNNNLIASYTNTISSNVKELENGGLLIESDIDSSKIELYNFTSQKRYSKKINKRIINFFDFNHKNQLQFASLGETETLTIKYAMMNSSGKIIPFTNNFLKKSTIENTIFGFQKNDIAFEDDKKTFFPIHFSKVGKKGVLLMNDLNKRSNFFAWNNRISESFFKIAMKKHDTLNFFKFFPNSGTFLAATHSEKVYLYKNRGTTKVILQGSHAKIKDCILSDDEKFFTIMDRFNHLKLYDQNGNLIKTFYQEVETCYFSNDNNYFILIDKKLDITFWPLTNDFLKFLIN